MSAMEPVVIGVVLRAHGIHGVVRTRPTGPTLPELPLGTPVRVAERSGAVRECRIEFRSGNGDQMLIGLAGIATREAAEQLQGAELSVDATLLPPAGGAGEFYVRDLVGCSVRIGGVPCGRVSDVINRPANDVLEVVDDAGGLQLLPFSRDAVVSVDLEARRIDLRQGLIDIAPSAEVTDAG
jgi:16S rRNA processing protein RimM